MQLQPDRAEADLLAQRLGYADIAFAEKPQIHRESLCRLEHFHDVPGAGRARRRNRTGGRPCAAPDHRRDARHQRFFDLLRADEMDMRIDAARSDEHAFARNDLGRRADDDRHGGLDVGIARLADAGDAPVLDPDVGFYDAPVIDDQCVGDYCVCTLPGITLALAHAVTDHFAAAELHFLAVDREIFLDFNDEIGIRQTHAIAGGGPEHFCISLAIQLEAHFPAFRRLDFFFTAGWSSFPITLPRNP